MKRLLIIVAAVVMLTAASIGAGFPVHVTAREPSETDSFVPNQVDLYMPSNPMTGYAWAYDIRDPAIIAVRDQYFEDSSQLGNVVGEGGTHWFHISGLRSGTTSVTFRYLRPWEPDQATKVTTYRMTVDDALNVLIWGVEAS